MSQVSAVPFHSQPLDEYPGDRRVRLTRPATDSDGQQWPVGTIGIVLASGYDNPSGCVYADLTLGPSGRVRFLAAPSITAWITWGAVRGRGPIRATRAAAAADQNLDRRACRTQGGYSDRRVYAVDRQGWVRHPDTHAHVFPHGPGSRALKVEV